MRRIISHVGISTLLVASTIVLLLEMKSAFAQAPGGASPPASANSNEGERRGNRRRRNREGSDRRGERDGDRADRPAAESKPAPPAPVASSGFGAPSGASDADRSAGIRKWATDLIKTNDKNNNMMLEPGEQTNLGSSSRGADANGDGVITLDELVAHVSPKSDGAASPPAPPKPVAFGTQSSAEETSVSDDEKSEDHHDSTSKPASHVKKSTGKSYRFRSAKDRQPSWRFSGKDSNGDGQVSMSEFSGSWTDRTAAEFKRYDRDNDGMITPDEVR